MILPEPTPNSTAILKQLTKGWHFCPEDEFHCELTDNLGHFKELCSHLGLILESKTTSRGQIIRATPEEDGDEETDSEATKGQVAAILALALLAENETNHGLDPYESLPGKEISVEMLRSLNHAGHSQLTSVEGATSALNSLCFYGFAEREKKKTKKDPVKLRVSILVILDHWATMLAKPTPHNP